MKVKFVKDVFGDSDCEYVGMKFDLEKLDEPVIRDGHVALYSAIDPMDGLDIFIYEGEYEVIENMK